MNSHLETWTLGERNTTSRLIQEVITPGGPMTITSKASAQEMEPRAVLMVALPGLLECARVLLAVEWSGRVGYDGDIPGCPSCKGSPHEHAFDTWVVRYGHDGHAKHCALDAALRKAGPR